MKVSLIYPKIPENTNGFLNKCIAFEKYDGTNLHWKWDPQDGWTHFGTRRTQFPLNKKGMDDFAKEHSELANAPYIFNDVLRDKLTKFFCINSAYHMQTVFIFTEFYGTNSFAGNHDSNDEHELIIIDVMLNGKLMPPELFTNVFYNFRTAQVVYRGKYTGQFTEDVRKGKYNVNEGVVCKGVVDGEVFMTKIKTKDYLKRLEKR